jgi:hypothetical protein
MTIKELVQMSEVKPNHAQLGCGTLILIALIVLIFSGGTKVGDMQSEIQDLKKQVIVLQEKVDALSKAVENSRR